MHSTNRVSSFGLCLRRILSLDDVQLEVALLAQHNTLESLPLLETLNLVWYIELVNMGDNHMMCYKV